MKNMLRGYRGGPNFNKAETKKYLLDGFQVEITLPISNVEPQSQPTAINFPLNQKNWFKQNASQVGHRSYVLVQQELWFFLPLIPKPIRAELGEMSLSISLQKITSDEFVEINSVEMLGQYLLAEYNDYYNSISVGNFAKGINTEIRNKAVKQSAERAYPYTSKELQDNVRLDIEAYGFPKIDIYQVIEFSGRSWVFYQENRQSLTHFYSMLVSKDFYLTCKFNFTTNASNRSDRWFQDAIDDSRKMMHCIQITCSNEMKKLSHSPT